MFTLSLRSLCGCNVPVHNALPNPHPAYNPLHEFNPIKFPKFSNFSLNKNHRNCRCCIAQNQHNNFSITKDRDRDGVCTYGDHNSQWLSLELQRLLSMQNKPSSGIVLTRGKWNWDVHESSMYQFSGIMRFHNVTKRNEVFITEVQGRSRLFSSECLNGIDKSIQVISRHPGGKPAPREDGYWPVYVIRAGENTCIEVIIQVNAEGGKLLEHLQTILVELEYVSYGPHGCSTHLQHVILPLQYTHSSSQTLSWKNTHIQMCIGWEEPAACFLYQHIYFVIWMIQWRLSKAMFYLMQKQAMSSPLVKHHWQSCKILAAGRFRHPRGIHPGMLARLVCRLFHPTSSLATACGMQTLIDICGNLRVVFASFLAIIARFLGIRGMFYRLAGEQARLIDDASGTLPPYDQFVTLGPVRCQETVDDLKSKTGYEMAIVDVNDLKRVQILAASFGVDSNLLEMALIDNPAGNQDEQTPIVLVRGLGPPLH